MTAALVRRLLAELVGTGLLVAVVVGSGIAAQRLSPNDGGLRLLESSTATVLGLAVLILLFGPVSGAHFNPVVSAMDWLLGRRAGTGLAGREVPAYAFAQCVGAVLGALLANAMFELAIVQISTTARSGGGQWLAETVATAGLIAVVFALARTGRAALSAGTVGAYIGAAYWSTSSTSFANPAVAIGRMFSDTFAGISPGSVPGFVLAQLVGGVLGAGLVGALYPDVARGAALQTAAGNVGDELDGGKAPTDTPVVLFLCTHNAGRSQMALGFFTHLAGGRALAWSGGSEPASAINPAAVEAMAERGIDISREYPKPWTDEVVRAADVVITMGCGDACPVFPGRRHEEWVLDDPAGQSLDGVRPIRDEIERRVRTLLAEIT